MAQLVSATLDAKTYAIWRTLDNKSEWLRRMLAYHGLENAVLVEHMGTPTASWGLFAGDARCNPASCCPKCWKMSELKIFDKHVHKLNRGVDADGALEELRREHANKQD